MKIAILYIYLFVFLCSFGQTDYRFTNYTINEGLSQSSVTCIVQDEVYTLWVGTQDGLNRYNGREFKIYNSDNTPGLKTDYYTCATTDRKGDIWFGTVNGLSHFNLKEETFQSFFPKNTQGFNIKRIIVLESEKLLIATAESGLFEFDPNQKSFKDLSRNLPSSQLIDITQINKSSVIISTNDKGLGIFDVDKQTWNNINVNLPAATTVNKVIVDTDKSAILATNQGVFSVDISTGDLTSKFKKLDSINQQLNVTDISYNQLKGWFITTLNNGLYTLTNDGTILHSKADFFQRNALIFDELNVIYGDVSGVYWIGSQRGLTSFFPGYQGILGIGASGNYSRGLASGSVWSFEESKDGKYLYIGTDLGFTRLNKSTGVFEQFLKVSENSSESGGEKTVLDLELISENRVLAGCADGFFDVLIKDGKSEYRKIELSKDDKHQHKRVYKIVHYKDKSYLIATVDGVVLYDLNKGVLQRFENNAEDPKTIIKGVCRVAYKDKKGDVWFATSLGGLNKLSVNNGIISIVPHEYNSKIKAATSDFITTIWAESSDVFWLGTAGSGIVRHNIKTGESKAITKSDGLPNNVIYGVLGDQQGNIWMSTNKGLCCLNLKTKETKVYTELDGLLAKEFNLGAYLATNNGNLFFGGIYGCNYFNPKELEQEKKNIEVVLSGLIIDNKRVTPGTGKDILSEPIFVTQSINLNYQQRSFTVQFHTKDLIEGEKVNYKYVLEGSDDGEVYLGGANEIHFTALEPGEYTLKVFARKGYGQWSLVPATLKIYIAKPFWMMWWFRIIMVLILALIIRFIVRKRIDLARRDQIKLEIKIRDRTKEIEAQKVQIQNQNEILEQERIKVLKQQELLKIEKEKSEKLLKNVIPESTAEELKKSGKARARAYKTVSVLFTDFVGFTKISDRLSPTELVRKLDVYFTKFDEIIVKNNLEKIKTIGDAYMCAGGVPVRNNTNPIDTCLAALQIQDYMEQRKNEALANGDEYWDLRLGINTGEVTAGVIGSERLAYDVWGATVNQAQRMEMLGEPGKVTITGATYQHIEPYFECTFKGKAQSKSRGIIDMYVVDRIKPELSIAGKGVEPNKRFHQIVNLHHYSSINYYKAERHIMKLLETQLTKDLYYHSIDHTKDVVQAVEHIALLENVTDEGLFLLKSAATYHDAGFVEKYDNNEPVGARLAEEILPRYGYTEQHINQIKELIYVTMIPHEPKNQLEEIMCDADLDYLGRDDFHEISDRLRRELKEHGKIESRRQWDEIQVKFLSQHKYFTKTAIKTRQKKKEKNLQEVIERLKKNEYKD